MTGERMGSRMRMESGDGISSRYEAKTVEDKAVV